MTVVVVAVVGIVALGVGILVGWTVRGRRIDDAVVRIRAATEVFGHGDLAARVPIDGAPPHLAALARAFNEMAARIETLVTAQETFVSDASHQLRTPLTALRLQLENLGADLDDGRAEPGSDGVERIVVRAECRDEVQAAVDEVDRIARLVGGLLALARADRAAGSATIETIAAGDLVRLRVQAWADVAAEYDVTVEADGSADGLLDGSRVEQILDNLIANAVDVSPPGSTVTLRCGPLRSWLDDSPGSADHGVSGVEFHVIDQGPGLTEEERHRAFDRFWRGSASGRTDLGGSGLGLAIVRKLVEIDGGTVELRDAPGGGIDAVVRYPQG